MEQTKIAPKWEYEQYEEYLKLKSEQEKRVSEAKSDYNKLFLRFPETLLENVPESKRENVLSQAKIEVFTKEMELAKELIVKLNSPGKIREKEIAGMKVSYRNFVRQLIWNKGKLEQLKAGQELDPKEFKFQIKFNIDKLNTELELLAEDLKFYGVDVDALRKEALND